MLGQMVEFPSNGSTAQGYLAPATGGSGPAVIVIQEWWGLVDPIEAVADRFAAERNGFVTPEVARKLQAEVTSAGKRMDIHSYEGADNGFLNDTREDVYDAGAGADAWNRTLTFLRGAL
jgi:dienelactone hydrolase